MKRMLFFVIAMLMATTARANVLISEVIIDPLATDTGGEAVELYNPHNYAIDIGNWIISTKSSATDATIPANTTIAAHSYYLIADSGWSASKDNASWPDADHEEALTLANVDAGVALKDGDTIIDAVGWGERVNIPADYYEGNPHPAISSGHSLERRPGYLGQGNSIDTNNNSADFLDRDAPEPQSSQSEPEAPSSSNSMSIGLEVHISNSGPEIQTVILEDHDVVEPGSQILPFPGSARLVQANVTVYDANGASDIQEVTAQLLGDSFDLAQVEEIDTNTALFSGNLSIAFYESPGIYTVTVTAEDSSSNVAITDTSFEFYEAIGISVDSSLLNSSADPGSKIDIVGDKDFQTLTHPTIRNIGNALIDLQLWGDDLTYLQSSIAVENINYSLSADLDAGKPLSKDPVTENIALGYGSAAYNELSLRIGVPASTSQGSYAGLVYIGAVKS